jgi:glycosyltransferase involved in cell wall biosynthesis
MKIWILGHYAVSPDSPGITRHYDIAAELIKHGHQVSIFSSSFDHTTRRDDKLRGKQNYQKQNINGVEFIWIKTSPYYRGNDWRRVVNMLSYTLRVIPLGVRYNERPDVVLASSPHPFAGLAGYILAKTKRAQFVFEVCDLWPETFVEIGGYSNRSTIVKLLRVLEKFLYKRATKIVTVMPNASDYITKRGIPKEKIVYIPNGVDPDFFHNTISKMPEDLSEIISGLKSKKKVLVGYTGNHGVADSLSTLIEAAKFFQDKGLANIHFLLVGDGPDKKTLLEKAKGYSLNNVTFYNPIPKRAIPALLGAIDIAILTKRKSDLYKYGISFCKLFDYSICEKPIVWAVDSINNPVAEANCGITVPPESPVELSKAILELCELTEKERQDMGRRGYEYVMKYHSMPILAGRLLAAFGETSRG